MKIAENRSERKESTKESQGDIFFEMMGFCRKTMTISKDYEKIINNHQRQWKIINDYERQ
jgi:hypothetical protein